MHSSERGLEWFVATRRLESRGSCAGTMSWLSRCPMRCDTNLRLGSGSASGSMPRPWRPAALRNICAGALGPGERAEDLARLDRKRKGKKLLNQDWVSKSDPEAKRPDWPQARSTRFFWVDRTDGAVRRRPLEDAEIQAARGFKLRAEIVELLCENAPDMAARARERAQAIPAPCRRPQFPAQTEQRGSFLVAQMVLRRIPLEWSILNQAALSFSLFMVEGPKSPFGKELSRISQL